MRRTGLRQLVLAGLMIGAGASAQLLPGLGGGPVGGLVNGVLQPVTGSAGSAGMVASRLDLPAVVDGLDRATLLDLRRQRLDALVRTNRAVLDRDEDGNPVRRGEIIVIDPAPDLLAEAMRAGFAQLREERMNSLGLTLVVLAPPRGKDAGKARAMLEKIDPRGQFVLNHVYEPAGGELGGAGQPQPSASTTRQVIGMIDGGVAAHPAFAHAAIEQRGFAPGAPRASGHGTAIASLIAGQDGIFRGAAPDAALLVADVYGGDPASGSAERIAQALGWMVERHVRVVTISLVGPPNRLIERAIARAQARGTVIVAAVGNDGPAAPPQYPASYPGVIAVTGVDAHDRALAEAGRPTHLDFAAPGADMAAATPGKGYAAVRGTSFAAPLVAARLALAKGEMLATVSSEAVAGKGRVGRGIVCHACRIAPKLVKAKI